jgi:hypothetical protein
MPILLIVTARPGIDFSWLSKPHVSVRVLNALTEMESARLITQIAAVDRLRSEVVHWIIAASDGVPLFIEELTRSILDGSFAGLEELASYPQHASPDTLPITLQALLRARLDQGVLGKELAQVGSVLGREFSFNVLREVAESSDTQLISALDELVQSGLLVAHGRPPDAMYRFKHSLVQDAAYASMLRTHRKAVHARAAQALQNASTATSPVEPEVIAWHLGEGGQPERATDFYLLAAEQASGRFALTERVLHLRSSLKQIRASSSDMGSREIEVRLALGRTLIDTLGSGSKEVRDQFEQAALICEQTRHKSMLLNVHDGLANSYFTRSETAELLKQAAALLESSSVAESRQALLLGKRSEALAYMLLGEFAKADAACAWLDDNYDLDLDRPGRGPTTRDIRVAALTMRGTCLTALGLSSLGAAESARAVEHARALGHRVSLVLALRRSCVQALLARNAIGVKLRAAELLEIDEQYQTFLGRREGILFLNLASLHDCFSEKSFDALCAVLSELEAAEHYVLLPFFMACAAEAAGKNNRRDAAAALVNRSKDLAERTKQIWCLPELLRLEGLYCERGQRRVELWQRGHNLARKQGAKLWETRLRALLASEPTKGQGKRCKGSGSSSRRLHNRREAHDAGNTAGKRDAQ